MSALTEVRICNLALGKIGAERITSLSQDKKEAKLCSLFYSEKRDEVLEAHPWNFATDRVALTQIGTAPISGYAYQYQLPVSPKCLKVLEITESVGNWKVEGDYLLCNEDTVEIRYIKQVVDVSKFDSLFTDALACLLASELAIPITENLQMANMMYQKYLVVLRRARGEDNMEQNKEYDEPAMWGDA